MLDRPLLTLPLLWFVWSSCCWTMLCSAAFAQESPSSRALEPTVRLDHSAAGDQDDLCIWRDDAEPQRSVVITSDKKANLIAVYDLEGRLLQTLAVPKPGNIDLRRRVRCGDTLRDLIVINQRTDGWKLVVLEMDRASRQLRRLDRGDLLTGSNYGVCLYHSRRDGTLYAITTSEDGATRQYALSVSAAGEPAVQLVREWKIGKAEGAVADDALGRLYVSEEERGVWELGAEPDQPVPGELVIRSGEADLKSDLEGVTLIRQGERDGYLILSSQGNNRYCVYERQGSHRYVGSFAVEGAMETDGIDVCTEPLGEKFPHGLFGCHTARGERCSVLLTPWEKVAKALTLNVPR